MDLVFGAVLAGVREPQVLCKVMDGHSTEEVQHLLIQLLVGEHSLYVKDTNLIQAMGSYANRHPNFKTFDAFLLDYTRNSKEAYHPTFNRPRELQPTLVSQDELTPAHQ